MYPVVSFFLAGTPDSINKWKDLHWHGSKWCFDGFDCKTWPWKQHYAMFIVDIQSAISVIIYKSCNDLKVERYCLLLARTADFSNCCQNKLRRAEMLCSCCVPNSDDSFPCTSRSIFRLIGDWQLEHNVSLVFIWVTSPKIYTWNLHVIEYEW